MVWKKLGRVLEPAGQAPWMRSHAALPFATPLDGDVVRVFCAGRDSEGRGQTGYVDIRLTPDGATLLNIAPEPSIPFGPLGAFDDRGALPSCIVQSDQRWYQFYSGVMLGQTVPFYYLVGLAVSDDEGQSWIKWSDAPILPFGPADPYLTASPFVIVDEGRWRMWYSSGLRWELQGGIPKHYYHLKYAESHDGIVWHREGRVAIDLVDGEYAISRPSVIRDPDRYRMWFASRGAAYRINYAESLDGITWHRKDEEAGIDVSSEDWDSEMICYPHVFDHNGNRYMLYNGNGYGRNGFGAAVLI